VLRVRLRIDASALGGVIGAAGIGISATNLVTIAAVIFVGGEVDAALSADLGGVFAFLRRLTSPSIADLPDWTSQAADTAVLRIFEDIDAISRAAFAKGDATAQTAHLVSIKSAGVVFTASVVATSAVVAICT
jgi:hypothetical protein